MKEDYEIIFQAGIERSAKQWELKKVDMKYIKIFY